MTCDEIRELLEMYALGILDRDEHIEIASHLADGCDVCNRNLRRAIGFNSAMLLTVKEAEVPASLRKRVLSTVKPVAPARPWAWIGVAAALAAGLAFVTWDGRVRTEQLAVVRQQAEENAREAQRLNAAFTFLRDPQTRPANAAPGANQPRGTYFISPRGVLLIASNLPQLRPGQTFEMWVIPKGQAPRPAGLFRSDNSGSAVHFVSQDVDVAQAAALAISVEPEAGSTAPSTTPLLVTPVSGL
ncbi:MAG: anti-sigma factor [Bryobacteraceae bacterium]|nr:anti-sigma factor [Bryobacteraceae bacterium]